MSKLMVNWFEIFAEKLTAIEEEQKKLRLLLSTPPCAIDAEPFGDFGWLQSVCAGVPPSTLRIKSAAGEIPGTVKFGKRVLYEKMQVLDWLRSKTRQLAPDAAEVERTAEGQVSGRIEERARRQRA